MNKILKKINQKNKHVYWAVCISLFVHVALIGVLTFKRSNVEEKEKSSTNPQKNASTIPVSGIVKDVEDKPFPSKEGMHLLHQHSRFQARTVTAKRVSARALMKHPTFGEAMSMYFKSVRQRLVYAAGQSSMKFQSNVHVDFVLRSDGLLAEVLSAGSTEVHARVTELLKTAAPFPPFPESIPHEIISFEVLFRIDESHSL